MTKQSIVFMLCTLLLVPAAWIEVNAAPTQSEFGTILNLSGRQRMLTQKMSKEMMLIALKVDTEGNLKNLKATSELFEKTLLGLKDGDAKVGLPKTKKKRIRKQIEKVEGLWAEFKKIVQAVLDSKTVTAEQVAALAKQNLPLLKQMNKAVKLYEKQAAKSGLKASPEVAITINLAGKQRMLTQKMSKEFFLVAYGHDVDANKLNLLETYTLFDKTLAGLLDGDKLLELPGTKDEGIRKQLAVVQGLWAKFKPAVIAGADATLKSVSSDQVTSIAQQNIPLLKEMNKAVKMYEKLTSK